MEFLSPNRYYYYKDNTQSSRLITVAITTKIILLQSKKLCFLKSISPLRLKVLARNFSFYTVDDIITKTQSIASLPHITLIISLRWRRHLSVPFISLLTEARMDICASWRLTNLSLRSR